MDDRGYVYNRPSYLGLVDSNKDRDKKMDAAGIDVIYFGRVCNQNSSSSLVVPRLDKKVALCVEIRFLIGRLMLVAG